MRVTSRVRVQSEYVTELLAKKRVVRRAVDTTRRTLVRCCLERGHREEESWTYVFPRERVGFRVVPALEDDVEHQV